MAFQFVQPARRASISPEGIALVGFGLASLSFPSSFTFDEDLILLDFIRVFAVFGATSLSESLYVGLDGFKEMRAEDREG